MPSRFPCFSFKMSRFFCVFRVGENMLYALCSASSGTRKQLPVLDKANSLCEVSNISLQPGTPMILKRVFRNTRSQFDRAMYLFVKCPRIKIFRFATGYRSSGKVRVASRRCTIQYQCAPDGRKILTRAFYAFSSSLSRFFAR